VTTLEESAPLLRAPFSRLPAIRRVFASPRLLVYSCCTLLAILTSWWLGKDMQWDTLDYHFYAGFSAIHDRFGLDYFAAGVQSYFNPYAYAPFYLLATSGLTALEVATIFAVIHSAILWLSYELAGAIAPWNERRTRVAMGVCAAVLAFSNPVLIDQFGSSYADITTAELALAGCLLLFGTFRVPEAWRIVGAGALLGAASALKLSNGLTAASLMIVPLFLAAGWRRRVGYTALLGLCTGASFVLVCAPWSIPLARHFGNPLFPMLNNVFRSPYYTTGPNTDSLFIPATVSAALWRPFAMVSPVRLIHYEQAAPDARYAILLVIAALALLGLLMRRFGRTPLKAIQPYAVPDSRPVLALGCAFLINWALWLSVSGNSRYFLCSACLAAVLDVALLFRLLAQWPRLRNVAAAAVLVAQIHGVVTGAVFRAALPWNKGPWFEVSVPAGLASKPALYFNLGIQANAFVVPFLAPGSGFINVDGGWILGPAGASGARIRALIAQFSPRLRVLVANAAVNADRDVSVPHLVDVNDALEPFGLRVDESRCATIVAPYAPKVEVVTFGHMIPPLPLSQWYTRYLVTCKVVRGGAGFGVLPPGESSANLVLDRLEDVCPAVLEPRRSDTFLLNGPDNGRMWVRRYGNTHVAAWVSSGQLRFQAMLGHDSVHDLGTVGEWETTPPRIACGRRADGMFFVRVASAR
jgi:hypothetical protein